MSHVASFALSYLLNSIWQVPLVLLCGLLAARLLRPLGPAAEHRVWTLTLLLQSLLPACSFSIDSLVVHLSFWMARASQHSGATVSTVMGPGSAFASLHLSALLLSSAALIYLVFLLGALARFLWRLMAVSALRRNAIPLALNADDLCIWKDCCEHFGIRTATLAGSRRVGGPVTLGLRRKLILLPAAMLDALHGTDLRTVLAHEFAHMRRWDFAKNLLYEFVSLPVSYHPLVWVTRTHLTQTREIVCDQVAAELTGRGDYARSLLRLASMLVVSTPTAPHVIGMGVLDAHTFERRLMLLTEKPSTCHGARRALTLTACSVFAFAVCATALTLRVSVSPTAVLAASAQTPRTVRTSSAVMAGNILTRVDPVYPPEAKEAKIQGAVVLRAIIGKDGKIENLRVVSGPKELQKSALDAVRQWIYKPYLLNGEPTEVDTDITVNYALQP